MNHNRSVATIDAPEFINLEQNAINPGISQCEIKVLYLGKNRNGSFIDKNTAIQMANSLPGTPIVGAWRKDIEDFGDHGHVMHIEDGEVTFSCKTVPFGFVAPDAQVWFQTFTDTNDFGEEVEREYLMTSGYLWTSQYEEALSCLTEGKGQSMELDEETLNGHWATEDNSGMEFFIINDAIFSKLCILGDDVEPCFEGAAVTGPNVSKNFSQTPEFSHTLFTMMNELKFALQQNKGGSSMDKNLAKEQLEKEDDPANNFSAEPPAVNEPVVNEPVEEFKKDEKDPKEKQDEKDPKEKQDEKPEDKDPEEKQEDESKDDKKSEDEDKDDKKKPSAKHNLEEETAVLQDQISTMEQELESLREFKKTQDNLQKDALINKYFMLSAEDKADIIAHKEEYSLSEIEAKLALMYVKNNVDFSAEGTKPTEEKQESVVTTFSMNQNTEVVPAMVEALRQTKRN